MSIYIKHTRHMLLLVFSVLTLREKYILFTAKDTQFE